VVPELRLEDGKGTLKFAGNPDLTLEPTGSVQGTVFILIPADKIKERKIHLKLGVYEKGERLESFETTFMAPGMKR